MPIRFSCPSCRKAYVVADHLAGKTAKCKGCGKPMTVPAAVPAESQLASLEVIPDSDASPCPSCSTDMAPGAVICFNCGYDIRTGKVVQTSVTSSTSARASVTKTRSSPSSGSSFISKFFRFRLMLVGITLACVLLFMGANYIVSLFVAGGINGLLRHHTAEASAPIFPPLPAPNQMMANSDHYQINISGTGPGSHMHVHIFLPSAFSSHPNHSLPCIFIAPAGTTMLTGSVISQDDLDEYDSYLRHGFAVAAFDLDGPVHTGMTNENFAAAVREFEDARYGMVNAHIAIEYVLANVPAINPDQLFAAGHSSAGGLALNFAAEDHRIKAVAAYAPATDILGRQPADFIKVLSRFVPDIYDFAAKAAPMAHVSEINCPILIFHSDADTVVSSTEIQAYVDALRAAGKDVQYKTVPTGDHYTSMLVAGISDGIDFFHTYAPSTTGIDRTPPAPRVTYTPPVNSDDADARAERLRRAIAERSASNATDPIRPHIPDAAARARTLHTNAIDHYKIPDPNGFTAEESRLSIRKEWTRTTDGHAVQSTFEVRVIDQGVPVRDLFDAKAKTLVAGNIVFRQQFNSAAGNHTHRITYYAIDDNYRIDITLVLDDNDPLASIATANAIRNIRAVVPDAPTTAPN